MPVLKINKPYTIHTSRTIMFKELSDLISQGVFNETQIHEQNVVYKATRSNLKKTVGFLSKLYDYKEQNILWKVFIYLWKKADEHEKRLMTLLYAISKDEFLHISQNVVLSQRIGTRIAIQSIQRVLEEKYPNKYSQNTLISSAKNIASSWKQARYIEGKIKNIRVPIHPGYFTVVFALYLGYNEGKRGEDLLKTKWINLLELPENKLLGLLSEAAIRDLIDYNYTGGVTVIRFDKLLNAIK